MGWTFSSFVYLMRILLFLFFSPPSPSDAGVGLIFQLLQRTRDQNTNGIPVRWLGIIRSLLYLVLQLLQCSDRTLIQVRDIVAKVKGDHFQSSTLFVPSSMREKNPHAYPTFFIKKHTTTWNSYQQTSPYMGNLWLSHSPSPIKSVCL